MFTGFKIVLQNLFLEADSVANSSAAVESNWWWILQYPSGTDLFVEQDPSQNSLESRYILCLELHQRFIQYHFHGKEGKCQGWNVSSMNLHLLNTRKNYWTTIHQNSSFRYTNKLNLNLDKGLIHIIRTWMKNSLNHMEKSSILHICIVCTATLQQKDRPIYPLPKKII